MSEQPDPFLDYDAAYVMGALVPQERLAFEAHLTTCPQCRAGVAELAGMPGLLAQVPAAQVLAPKAAPDPLPRTLLPRLVAANKRQRRRRRVLSGVAGLVAAACLAVGIALTTGALGSDGPKPPAVAGHQTGSGLVMTAPGSGPLLPVSANVSLDPVAWGTKVDVRCTYSYPKGGSDLDHGTGPTYRIVLLPRNGGTTEQVAAWTALSGTTVTVNGSTDLKPVDIAEIRLIDSRGVTLLHAVPSA